MRKLILVLLIAVVIVAGYTAYWHQKADDFKGMVEQSITALNAEAKLFSKDTTLLRYESLQISGYPFAMTVEITKPVVDFPVSKLLETFRQPSALAVPAPTFNWIEEISYSQSVSLSGNITGNRFTLVTAGDRAHKTLVNNTTRHALVSSSGAPTVCHLGVETTLGAPWTMQPMFIDLPHFLAIFRGFDCDIPATMLKDPATGAQLFTMDGLTVKAANEDGKGTNRKLAFALDYKNAAALPAFDAIANDYLLLAHTIMGTAEEERATMAPLSQYGTQNLKADIRYEGPTEGPQFGEPQMSAHFDINTLVIKNAMMDIAFESHVHTAPEGSARTGTITVHGHSQMSELYDQLVAKQFATMFTQIMHSPLASDADAAKKLARLGTPDKLAATIMPKIHELGIINTDIEASVKGPNHPEEFLRHGTFLLEHLDWVAGPYGLTFKGKGDFSAADKLPSAQIVATCISCDALVTDLGNYAMRVEPILSQAQTAPQPVYASKELIEGVKQFLHAVAQNGSDKNARDLVIDFVMKDTGEMTLSGKQFNEVIGLFAMDIASHLTPAAASASPPAPPLKN